MDAVVNRHDRLARRQRRQDVVRRVKQVYALAPQIERNRDLLAYRVARRALRNRSEVRPKLADDAVDPRRGTSTTYSVA